MNDLTFTPIFFNPDLTVMFPDSTKRTTAQNLCYIDGGTDPDPSVRRECYFDFAVFEDPNLAISTVQDINSVVETQEALGLLRY